MAGNAGERHQAQFICGSGAIPHSGDPSNHERRRAGFGTGASSRALLCNKDMCTMKRIRVTILAGSSLLLLAACATTPPGPMIPVMPGPQKSPAAFNADRG